MKKTLYFGIGFYLLTSACKKHEPPILVPDNQINTSTEYSKVYVANEGNFQWGNAEITKYDLITNTLSENLYKMVNQTAMGDVCQSMFNYQNITYIVLNNSQKIEVVDAQFKKSYTLTGFTSPRYILPLNASKAYVTDLYANGIWIVNLATHVIDGKIPCNGWTEELILKNDKVYVTNRYSEYVYVINAATDQISDSIHVRYGSNSIQLDKNNRLWVLCSGDQTKALPGGLYRIEPDNQNNVNLVAALDNKDLAWRLRMNTAKDTLYYLQKDVFQLPISSTLPYKIISGENKNYYGLAIHPSGFVFVADAIDYVQKGSVEIYDSKNQVLKTFKAGIIPSDFMFLEE